MLSENRRMLKVFQEAGFEATRRLARGEVEVTFPIESTERFRDRVAERDHLVVTASLWPFFLPRSVAVIGASPRRGSIGGELFRNVLRADFAGAAYPVNRSGEPVAGVRAFLVCRRDPGAGRARGRLRPRPAVLAVADEALRAGVRALCVISAGFAEMAPKARHGRSNSSRSSAPTVRG